MIPKWWFTDNIERDYVDYMIAYILYKTKVTYIFKKNLCYSYETTNLCMTIKLSHHILLNFSEFWWWSKCRCKEPWSPIFWKKKRLKKGQYSDISYYCPHNLPLLFLTSLFFYPNKLKNDTNLGKIYLSDKTPFRKSFIFFPCYRTSAPSTRV